MKVEFTDARLVGLDALETKVQQSLGIIFFLFLLVISLSIVGYWFRERTYKLNKIIRENEIKQIKTEVLRND